MLKNNIIPNDYKYFGLMFLVVGKYLDTGNCGWKG